MTQLSIRGPNVVDRVIFVLNFIIEKPFFLKGVDRELRRSNGDVGNCRNNFLENKIKVNMPSRYERNIFCAVNPSEKESTCPGDSGK